MFPELTLDNNKWIQSKILIFIANCEPLHFITGNSGTFTDYWFHESEFAECENFEMGFDFQIFF